MKATINSQFSVERFNGNNSFTLWQRRVKDILVQQGLAKALKGNDAKSETMKDDDWEELMMKCVSTIRLYTVSLEQVQSSLVSHCTQKRSSFEDGESAALAVQSENRGKKSDGRSGWSNGSSSSSRGKGVQCYYCKEFGHVKRDCPLRKDKGKKCDDASSCNSLVVADDGDCLTVSEFRTLGGVVYIPKLRRNLISLSRMDSNGCKYFAGGGAMKITRGGKVLMKREKCEGLYRLIGKTVYSTKVWKRCAQGSGYPRFIVSSLVECGRALGILTKVEIVGIGSNFNNWFSLLLRLGHGLLLRLSHGLWSLIAASHGLRLRLPQSLLRRLLEGYKKRELKEEVERERRVCARDKFLYLWRVCS
ncbi:hypothetical protein Acr_26g0009090 [Actinidia rufa]|uniref:CCHC-type domain-containing protein n=1 Tax=Actinidia rufa TaxID=165716 RepID=A0A7J0H3L6_9ERIC|nr:hypothetical protein Acr_26g0009090 [Actinidia rufa]